MCDVGTLTCAIIFIDVIIIMMYYKIFPTTIRIIDSNRDRKTESQFES